VVSLDSFKGLISIGFAYFLIIIFPYLIFGFSFTYGIISYPDLIDLLFYPTVIGMLLYYTWRRIGEGDEGLNYLFAFFLIIHFVGHGFHWAANAIDVTIENVGGTPQQVHSYAYFLDEILSHKIMYYSLIALLLIILYASKRINEEPGKWELVLGELSSLIFGFSVTISFIEGQSPYEAIIFGVLSIIVTFLHFGGLREIQNHPFARYYLRLGIWILIWASAYYALFHGFPQPSEWMT